MNIRSSSYLREEEGWWLKFYRRIAIKPLVAQILLFVCVGILIGCEVLSHNPDYYILSVIIAVVTAFLVAVYISPCTTAVDETNPWSLMTVSMFLDRSFRDLTCKIRFIKTHG